LDRLLEIVGTGQGQVLVLRGEAGMGKTALLDYAVSEASQCLIARSAGVESEMELAYSGLQQLFAPLLTHLECLPAPQRDALCTAFGISAGPPPDRFLVGLAGLSLLSACAAEHPVICVVDDAQWLDRISAQALTFISRRLHADRIALIFAVRVASRGEDVLTGLPDLEISGLGDVDARSLLDSVTPVRLEARIRDQIVAEAHGNPLALVELPRGCGAADPGGQGRRSDTRPVANRVEQSFVRRLRSLPEAAQLLLLTAAAEPLGDLALLRDAARRLGIGPDAMASAEAAGLIEFDVRVRFRHPLVRSAAYRAASVIDRRVVHGALAAATDSETDPDRRAWHAAHSASQPDESIAGELERSAGRARARGGIAAEAAFLKRATELTPSAALRGSRALSAAEAKIEAAEPDEAYDLLATAELCPLGDVQQARVTLLRARITFSRNRGTEAAPILLGAAARLETLDGALARETYLEALGTTVFTGRLGSPAVRMEAARAARSAAADADPPRPVDLLLEGVATRLADGYAPSVPVLRSALAALRRDALRNEKDIMHWLWLAWLLAADLWDYETSHELATRAVQIARDAGALTVLPVALVYRAGVHVFAGDMNAAAALTAEAESITAAIGYAPVKTTQLVMAAFRGDEARTEQLISDVTADAIARGEGRVLGSAAYGSALLNNGIGRYDRALVAAQKACEYDDLGFYGWSLAELVEAAVRTGEREAAQRALLLLEKHTVAAGSDWALGFLARSRALVATDDEAEVLYCEAIERLDRTPILVHAGRAHLVYGEWLRRRRRRSDARAHLRIAEEGLNRIGADAFAERARRELAASGETVRRRSAQFTSALSDQEGQIARLAAEGLTNPQIGARLFLSAHTVEWHLRKVFAKLQIRSRRELSTRLSSFDPV
jgi:DNA-binding CsgD family transcriptional regulator